MKIWECKIGECEKELLPDGADSPMRRAVHDAYFKLTGKPPEFIFSGWGAELSESERQIVEQEHKPVASLEPLRAQVDLLVANQTRFAKELQQMTSEMGKLIRKFEEMNSSHKELQKIVAHRIKGQLEIESKIGGLERDLNDLLKTRDNG